MGRVSGGGGGGAGSGRQDCSVSLLGGAGTLLLDGRHLWSWTRD